VFASDVHADASSDAAVRAVCCDSPDCVQTSI
jgi:hypothetical protein